MQKRFLDEFCLPGGVQVPGRPPRTWRCPPDLVKVEVSHHLKAACRRIRESLPRHRRCLHPEQEEDEREGKDVSCSAGHHPADVRTGEQGGGAQTWMPGQKLAVSLALL